MYYRNKIKFNKYGSICEDCNKKKLLIKSCGYSFSYFDGVSNCGDSLESDFCITCLIKSSIKSHIKKLKRKLYAMKKAKKLFFLMVKCNKNKKLPFNEIIKSTIKIYHSLKIS